ncbi:MAG: hypothetical protein ACLFTT_18795 [Candidatus Hydrogenedentota bacterium]
MRGCLIGCVGVLVLCMLVAGFLVYIAYEFDFIQAAARVDTVSYIGGEPMVLARADPNRAAVLAVVSEAFAQNPGARQFVQAFMPHEASLAVMLDSGAQTSRQILALSLRRLAGLLDWSAVEPANWRVSPAQEDIVASKEQNGVFVVRSSWPTRKTTRQQVRKVWPEAPRERLALEGGHLLELVVDNRGGGAYLALEPFFFAPEAAPAMGSPAQDKTLAPISPPPLSKRQYDSVFLRGRTLRVTVDLVHPSLPANALDPTAVAVEVVIECTTRNARAAEDLRFLLMYARDQLYRALLEEGVVLDSDITGEDNAITARFTARNVGEKLIRMLRETQNPEE